MEGQGIQEPVPAMPGVVRYSPDTLLKAAEECVTLGIPVIALFPVIDPSLKTPDGIEAANPQGLVPRVVAALKQRFPRSEEHTSELQSLMRISYAVFCLQKKNNNITITNNLLT